MARQPIFAHGSDAAPGTGTSTTPTTAGEQEAAHKALREGIMNYECRQKYRGPGEVQYSGHNAQELEDTTMPLAKSIPTQTAMWLPVSAPRRARLSKMRTATVPEITGDNLKPAESGLQPLPSTAHQDPPRCRDPRHQERQGRLGIPASSALEGAFVAMSTQTTAIRAPGSVVSTRKEQVQPLRPGLAPASSQLRPSFISAALEHGFSVSPP